MVRARRRRSRPARSSDHRRRSAAASSRAVTGRARVTTPATSRTAPRSTGAGEAALRPVARRSWWRCAPNGCSRALLVRGKPSAAVGQAGPGAGGHPHEAVDGLGQGAGRAAPLGPGPRETLVAGLHAGSIEPGPVGEDMGRRPKPAAGAADVRPEAAGARQATLD